MAKKGFVKEFKRQIRFAIAAAIGFVIAFAWRDYILKSVGNFLSSFFPLTPLYSSFLIALIITLFGVLIIIVTSKLLE
jgi:uncharacterized membrane protein